MTITADAYGAPVCTRLCAKCFTRIVSFIPLTHPIRQVLFCPHFTDEETDMNPDLTTCALFIVIIYIFQNTVLAAL